jgi:hypothetical protein
MDQKPDDLRARIGLGFRAARGGGLMVAVTIEDGEPHLILSTTLAVADEGDQAGLEPYHLAAEMARDPEREDQVAAVLADALRRQGETATRGLAVLIAKMRDAGGDPVVAALLVNRAGWITDLLSYSLAWAEHVPVAEGLAVRDALRFAIGQIGVDLVEQDEKSLPEIATQLLGLMPDEIDARLKSLGVAAGKPWRREQKLACLAAWIALAGRS